MPVSRSRWLQPAAVALLLAVLVPVVAAAPPTLTGVSPDVSTFSPDGDGVRETVRYRYTLGGDSAQVLIEVHHDSTTGPVVRTLLDEFRGTGPDTVLWDGRDGGGGLQPDGVYWITASAANPDSTVFAPEVQIVLDTVAPGVSVTQVANPYAPEVPGADSLARVTLDLTDVAAGDVVTITFTPAAGGAAGQLAQVLSGGGTQVFGWDGRAFADGLYAVSARVSDGAGHAASALGPDLNLDRLAPVDTVTTPARSTVNSLIRTVAGSASDRSGLDKLIVTVTSSGGAVVDSLCPCAQATVPFSIPLPDSVAAADTITVEIFVRDLPGHERLRTRTFVVDSLPPPAPTFDALPTSVTRPIYVFSGTALEADSVFVTRNGVVDERLRVVGGRFQGALTLEPGSQALRAQSKDRAGNLSPVSSALTVTLEAEAGIVVPERFTAGEAIRVDLDAVGEGVTAFIYTLHGRLVRTLTDESRNLFYDLVWDLRDDAGSRVGSGPYVVRVRARVEDGRVVERRAATLVAP